MSFWPKTDEEITERIRQRLVFYTEGAIPPVYQAWDKGKASGAVFVNGGQRTANLEFPWRSTAGLDDCPNAKVIRAVALESNGLRWWPEKLSNGASNGIRWEYAPGTVFCEILLVTDERGGDHTFELRTRRKVPAGTWVVNVYRPFPTEDSLREAVAKRGFRYPDVTGQRLTKQSVNVRESDGRAVRGLVSFEADFVPVADLRARPDLVRDLLDTAVFTSAKHNPWRDRHDGLPGAFAPAIDTLTTRNDSFSIVPVNYEGSFLKVGQTSCMRCHDDAGKVVVEPGDTRWRIRGDDAIFSFHPFDPDGLAAGVMRLNPRLVGAGLIARKEFP